LGYLNGEVRKRCGFVHKRSHFGSLVQSGRVSGDKIAFGEKHKEYKK
jgi:hypothetical protein